jgi:hypothetical protein
MGGPFVARAGSDSLCCMSQEINSVLHTTARIIERAEHPVSGPSDLPLSWYSTEAAPLPWAALTVTLSEEAAAALEQLSRVSDQQRPSK